MALRLLACLSGSKKLVSASTSSPHDHVTSGPVARVKACAGAKRQHADAGRGGRNRSGTPARNSLGLSTAQSPAIPTAPDPAWARNPIDHFVAASLSLHGLTPSPEADRKTLIRRLTFGLHGLPPTPEEIDAFVQDPAPDAYERLVDRLLAEPAYGERWGRHWLDLARYTESQGFEYDHMRENAWHYRDYVIASFNQDKPYDRFIKEQIAGDVLPPVTTPGLTATSFLVCGPWDQAGNGQANMTQRLITREEELEDMISVVAQTFLGLTVNCARCHSHKFDPIPQADYYRMKAVFEGVRHGERSILPPEELRAREEAIACLKSQGATSEVQKLPPIPVSYIGVRKEPEPTHRLKRGDVRTPLEIVTPGALSAMPELRRRPRPASRCARSPAAPAIRPMGDRCPQSPDGPGAGQPALALHFGQGIVATPNDFGAAGARARAIRNCSIGWRPTHGSTGASRRCNGLIVCSATYRQASDYRTGRRPDGCR